MNVEKAVKFKLRKMYRFFVPKRIANYQKVRKLVAGKKGIEIGGPSKIFDDIIKVYSVATRVDGCNFSTNTIWEGNIREGSPYKYNGQTLGSQYINDAIELRSIGDGTYDFILSSHCLEHVANPIKALIEWRRVVKDGGLMVLVLPDPEYTFDHKRARTTFAHLLNDYEMKTDESDTTHVQDVIDNCDLERVYVLNGNGAKLPYEQHVAISSDNHNLRAIHHHVFTDGVVHEMLKTAGFELTATEHFGNLHMIYLAFKK
jgi:ubiquinone/menaquinone biosynthesis C-methylase UbiE